MFLARHRSDAIVTTNSETNQVHIAGPVVASNMQISSADDAKKTPRLRGGSLIFDQLGPADEHDFLEIWISTYFIIFLAQSGVIDKVILKTIKFPFEHFSLGWGRSNG